MHAFLVGDADIAEVLIILNIDHGFCNGTLELGAINSNLDLVFTIFPRVLCNLLLHYLCLGDLGCHVLLNKRLRLDQYGVSTIDLTITLEMLGTFR